MLRYTLKYRTAGGQTVTRSGLLVGTLNDSLRVQLSVGSTVTEVIQELGAPEPPSSLERPYRLAGDVDREAETARTINYRG